MGPFVQEEEDKAKVQKELSILTDRLQKASLVSAWARGEGELLAGQRKLGTQDPSSQRV